MILGGGGGSARVNKKKTIDNFAKKHTWPDGSR